VLDGPGAFCQFCSMLNIEEWLTGLDS
jgi:hypothetical protein